MTVNRSDIIKKKAEEWEVSREEARELVDLFFGSMKQVLVDEGRIELRGFGVFEVKQRDNRKGRVPGTGKTVEIPSRYVPTFSAGEPLKEQVNEAADE